MLLKTAVVALDSFFVLCLTYLPAELAGDAKERCAGRDHGGTRVAKGESLGGPGPLCCAANIKACWNAVGHSSIF